MAKRLIVTVGTSLFLSASWNNGGPLAEIDGYEQWLSLDSPIARRSSHSASYIEDQITNRVLEDPESSALVAQFAPELSNAERYSAEISTLISMRWKENRYASFGEFLGLYDPVVFVHGGGARNPGGAAARHLVAALKTHASLTHTELKSLDGAGNIQYELPSLVEYLQNLSNDETDLVATGGYKAYAIALGHSYLRHATNGWRLFYVHERDTAELIREWADDRGFHVGVGPREFPDRPGGDL